MTPELAKKIASLLSGKLSNLEAEQVEKVLMEAVKRPKLGYDKALTERDATMGRDYHDGLRSGLEITGERYRT